eukprot:93422-Chlamydomonas_euryale.AAC.1
MGRTPATAASALTTAAATLLLPHHLSFDLPFPPPPFPRCRLFPHEGFEAFCPLVVATSSTAAKHPPHSTLPPLPFGFLLSGLAERDRCQRSLSAPCFPLPPPKDLDEGLRTGDRCQSSAKRHSDPSLGDRACGGERECAGARRGERGSDEASRHAGRPPRPWSSSGYARRLSRSPRTPSPPPPRLLPSPSVPL